MEPVSDIDPLTRIGFRADRWPALVVPADAILARIVEQHRSGYVIHDGVDTFPAKSLSKLRHKVDDTSDRPCVGDWCVAALRHGGEWIIESLLPRFSTLARGAAALRELVLMREREGRHLARDLIHRLKLVRQNVRNIRDCHPAIMQRHREALRERVLRAGLEIAIDDDRLMKEVIFFADKSDITEEIIRLESHFSQVAHLLRRREPVGRTLEFISQEISREFNTIGAKANDAGISQRVVTCKAEMEKIREQIQNIE